jgi:OmpA-OmpF porin, OOP family
VDARRFQPPTDPAGSLYMEPTATPGSGMYNQAAWISYAWRPSVLRDENGTIVSKLVSSQLSCDLLANIGVASWGAVGLQIPVILYQGGDSDAVAMRFTGGAQPPQQAIGDMGLTAKLNLITVPPLAGFGLSVIGRATIPTGEKTSYVGEGAPTIEWRLLAEQKLVAFSLMGTAGFKLRPEERDIARQTFGNEIPWGVGISVKPQAFGWDDAARFTWVAEVHGAVMLPPSSEAKAWGQTTATSPVFAGLSSRMAVGVDTSVIVGVETSLTQALGSPPLRVAGGVQWAPREHDMDHDGIVDQLDQCQELAEDRDGFEDGDGCPDWDNDDDGVPDAQDKCPGEKEDLDGFEDYDGCPDYDNDHDGISDEADACPNHAGARRADPKTNGCPDRDGDGLADKVDKCPDQAEDKDGFEDGDGCPDPDNDGDGFPDADDACPNEAGPMAIDPKRRGCPLVDHDGDTFDDHADKCPDAAEVFNGIDDDDGCPDEGGKPLAAIDETKRTLPVTLAKPLKFKGTREAPEIDPVSLPALRALGQALNGHPSWVVAIGVKPEGPSSVAQQAALGRAFAVASVLRELTHRDGTAETVGWKAVESQPGAARNGVGVLVLAPAEPAAGNAEPAAGKAEPAAGKAKPAAGKAEPAAGKAEPAAGKAKPAAGKAKPAAGKAE